MMRKDVQNVVVLLYKVSLVVLLMMENTVAVGLYMGTYVSLESA
jgi:hypothetical protein